MIDSIKQAKNVQPIRVYCTDKFKTDYMQSYYFIGWTREMKGLCDSLGLKITKFTEELLE